MFWPDEARATRISQSGSVRSEQRSLAGKELPPEGLRRIWPGAALLVGYRPTAGYAPSSRLAPGQIGRNGRHRSYAHDHLGGPAFCHETQNLARFAFGDDLKRPTADFTIRGETLRRDAGIDDQLKALAAERAVNVRRDFHRTIGLPAKRQAGKSI